MSGGEAANDAADAAAETSESAQEAADDAKRRPTKPQIRKVEAINDVVRRVEAVAKRTRASPIHWLCAGFF